jgi:hypothetical protein
MKDSDCITVIGNHEDITVLALSYKVTYNTEQIRFIICAHCVLFSR